MGGERKPGKNGKKGRKEEMNEGVRRNEAGRH